MGREQISTVLRRGLTDAQSRAVTSPKRHVLVVAGAGAGETEVIARRILRGKDAIVAFTFTERAADEMKFRIRSWLEAITPAGEEVSIGGMYVGTIHGYCLAKIREYWPDEYHNFDILDEGARVALVLRGARFDSAQLREPLPRRVDLREAAVAHWDIESAGQAATSSRTYLDFVHRSWPYTQAAYTKLEQDYRDSGCEGFPDVEDILKLKNPAEKFAQLAAPPHPQAQFLWSIFRDVFHYCAVHLADIADNARDIDLAMRWGFGWAQGPFETWQAAGWQAVAEMIRDDIAHGRAMSEVPLPSWVFEREGVHAPAGSYSPAENALKPRSALPVYQRQLYPDRVLGEAPDDRGETLWENAGVRLWRRADQDARIGIVSITSKMHAIGDEVMDGMLEAIARAEIDLDGLVIWQPAPFAVGANLQQVGEACRAGQFDLLEKMVARFQRTSMATKHAQVPVVAAVQGMALGGGCEFVMHAAHRVFALESYVGLVEAGVGLIPAGGGSKEFALQAHALAQRAAGGDVFPYIQNAFQTIAMATVAKSAQEAIALGFGRAGDDVVFNANEILHAAIRRARAMAESAWRPALVNPAVTVAGRNGIATCEMMLVNMAEGGFISAHDYRVAKAAATALCGGEVDTNRRVSEQWILDVERAQFVELLKTEKTQQRIAHMLETGKPLRN